jgi:hypothetical protein
LDGTVISYEAIITITYPIIAVALHGTSCIDPSFPKFQKVGNFCVALVSRFRFVNVLDIYVHVRMLVLEHQIRGNIITEVSSLPSKKAHVKVLIREKPEDVFI